MYLLTGAAVLTFILAILPSSILQLEGALAGSIVEVLAAIGFIIGIIGTLGLIARRILDPKLKNYTSGSAIFNLFFLLALFLSGLMAIYGVPSFYSEMTHYAQSLIFLDTAGNVSGIISLHCIITLLFLAYLPFTKMLHFLAKYFTYHDVRWNDSPMIGNKKMQQEVIDLLNQKVTWAAPHLNADGEKNWVDIATEEKK